MHTEGVTLLHNSARGAWRLLLRSLLSLLLSQSHNFCGLPYLLAGITKPHTSNLFKTLETVDFGLRTISSISLNDKPTFSYQLSCFVHHLAHDFLSWCKVIKLYFTKFDQRNSNNNTNTISLTKHKFFLINSLGYVYKQHTFQASIHIFESSQL